MKPNPAQLPAQPRDYPDQHPLAALDEAISAIDYLLAYPHTVSHQNRLKVEWARDYLDAVRANEWHH